MRGRWLARSATVLTPAGRRSLATRGLRWLSGRIPPDLVDSFVLAQDIVDPAEVSWPVPANPPQRDRPLRVA